MNDLKSIIMLRSFVLILFCFLLHFPVLEAFSHSADSLPDRNPSYIGYRVALADVVIKKQETNLTKITCTVINTGREDIALGEDLSPPNSLVISFDASLQESGLAPKVREIRDAVMQSELYVRPGEIFKKMDFTVLATPALIVPTIPEPPAQANQEVVATPIAKETNPSDIAPEPVAENSEENGKNGVLTDKGEAAIVTEAEQCPDLIIESVRILKKTKKWVTLEYTITNQGAGSVALLGASKAETDNLALRAYMSRTEKLTRGSITLGGTYVDDLPKSSDGQLNPGNKYTGKIRLDIRKLTKFTPTIILELDPYMSVLECDETNNRNHILVGKVVE